MSENGEVVNQLQSKELERSVLAAVLVLPDSADEHPIDTDDFYDLRHKLIWGSFTAIRDTHETPDIAGIIDHLERTKKLDLVGGAAYITGLAADFVTDHGLEHNVASLKDYRARRLLVQQANWMAKNAFDLDSDLSRVQDQVIMAMSGLQTHGYRSRHIRDVVAEVYADAEYRAKNPTEVWGYETGLVDFDRITGGLQTAQTMYIAGQPGVGKSILANQIGAEVSGQCPVWLVSLEMKDKRLVQRLVSAYGEVETRAIKTGFMDDQEWLRLLGACEKASSQDIHIWDHRGMTLAQFRAEAARLVKQFGVKVIVLDYLYLLAGYDEMDMTPRTEVLSLGVQTIAEQLDVCIITVNSVVKEGMKGYTPGLADVRGSGQITHTADLVLFLTKAAKTGATIDSDLRVRNLTFTKMRDGDMEDGYKISLGLTRGYPKFVSLAPDGSVAKPPMDKERVEKTMGRFHE